MAFRFRRKEPVSIGLQRIADEQLQTAIRALRATDRPPDAIVHDVRTCCKKLRGLARLMRPALRDRSRLLIHTFRDEARSLSLHRDADVLEQLWPELTAEFPEEVPIELGALFHATVAARFAAVPRESQERLRAAFQAMADRMEGHRQSSLWQIDGTGEQDLLGGLTNAYGAARKTLKNCLSDRSTAALHELRKRTKDHWYHLRLVQNVWKPLLRPRSGVCSEVSDQLGRDHDLALFEEVLGQVEGGDEITAVRDRLLELVHQQRAHLQRQAVRQCRYLFAEKPRRFGKRMSAYWEIWRGGD